MCEPFTLTAIAAGTAAVAGGVSAYSQYEQGKYQAAVANENAKIAEQEAALAYQRGALEAGAKRMQTSQEIGEARARAADSGVDITSASTLDVIADARMMSELDAATIKNNAAREAWGYKVSAVNARAQAKLARYGGTMSAASTLIGTASEVASIGMSYKLGKKKPGTGGTTAGAFTE